MLNGTQQLFFVCDVKRLSVIRSDTGVSDNFCPLVTHVLSLFSRVHVVEARSSRFLSMTHPADLNASTYQGCFYNA